MIESNQNLITAGHSRVNLLFVGVTVYCRHWVLQLLPVLWEQMLEAHFAGTWQGDYKTQKTHAFPSCCSTAIYCTSFRVHW